MGGVREYRTPSAGSMSMLSDHAFVAPAGIFGGSPGGLARWEVVRKEETQDISPTFGSKATAFPIEEGDTVRISTSGGGGYGEPLERDPSRVREDVVDGKVSLEQARASYGVVLDPRTLGVNEEATRSERARMAGSRLFLKARRGGEPVLEEGMRVAWVNPLLADRGIAEGDMAEALADPLPSPIRFRVHFRQDLPSDVLLLDRDIWDLMGLASDERVWWRPLAAPG